MGNFQTLAGRFLGSCDVFFSKKDCCLDNGWLLSGWVQNEPAENDGQVRVLHVL